MQVEPREIPFPLLFLDDPFREKVTPQLSEYILLDPCVSSLTEAGKRKSDNFVMPVLTRYKS